MKRDDKNLIIEFQSVENKDLQATATISALSANSCRYSVTGTKQQGIDPAVQKKDALDGVLSICSALGYQCIAEEQMK
jgi:hypothetical protein